MYHRGLVNTQLNLAMRGSNSVGIGLIWLIVRPFWKERRRAAMTAAVVFLIVCMYFCFLVQPGDIDGLVGPSKSRIPCIIMHIPVLAAVVFCTKLTSTT